MGGQWPIMNERSIRRSHNWCEVRVKYSCLNREEWNKSNQTGKMYKTPKSFFNGTHVYRSYAYEQKTKLLLYF